MAQAQVQGEPTPQPQPQRRLLIIDDEPVICALLSTIARRLYPDLSVRILHNGQQALAEAAAFQPQAILLDLLMPGVDGFTTHAQLRADQRTAQIPIAVMTGLDTSETRWRLEESGGTIELRKPLEVPMVRSTLRRLLGE